MDKDILYVAIHAALKAGTEIMTIYTDPKADFGIEMKADNSPLTVADRRSNAVITEALADTPYPVLSEEGKAIPVEERRKWDELWVVDPLDGTKEFIKRNGEFTVNIAYVKKGCPMSGVIYIPVKRQLYFADIDLGAYRVDHISDMTEYTTIDSLLSVAHRLPEPENKHDNFVIVASRSHLTPETQEYISRMKEEHDDVTTISSGSSLKLCLVAEGKADVYPRFAPTMEWDTAAGHTIVKASGGEVYQAGKDVPLQYNKESLLNPCFIVFPEVKDCKS